MEKYSCIVIEDEPLARNLITAYIQKSPNLVLQQAFSNGLEALEYLRDSKVDIMFSDIQMPELTGIALLKLLKNKPIVILTTAYSEYAIEGYELEVFDYLLKPISFERFLKTIEKVIARLDKEKNSVNPIVQNVVVENNEPKSDFIFVKDGTKLVKVNFADILYIEGLKDYVCIYTPDQKIVTLQTMKSLENTLPAERFIRVHNSFIIAFNAINSIERDRVTIGKNLIPVSDSYKKAFKDFIEKKQI
ncbi:MAG: response regulator transcription factor [Cytophagaceae bacterium]|nr:response regulator transcription factor [Cytophagaceae bacterium]